MPAASRGSIDIVLNLLTANADVNLEDNVCKSYLYSCTFKITLLLFSLVKQLLSMP